MIRAQSALNRAQFAPSSVHTGAATVAPTAAPEQQPPTTETLSPQSVSDSAPQDPRPTTGAGRNNVAVTIQEEPQPSRSHIEEIIANSTGVDTKLQIGIGGETDSTCDVDSLTARQEPSSGDDYAKAPDAPTKSSAPSPGQRSRKRRKKQTKRGR